ncbi:hypothetical protein JQ604_29720 [Bradyrhizobium jicamae]|uniref:DUF5691 domain-containing protein n=1 Tax=Bradyrhizobium jicamae TaxID=280332 RepID=UPI001BA729EB|nr:DUF5691 domain-containing protein [Bradyrhizobium jicamae]MBR0756377.1 hypothetical protein [Bradyrhizobium jicamae]
MTDAIFDTMGAVLTRWTMGSAAAPAAAMWRDELGNEPAEAELRLLALSGQFLGVAVTAEPPATLHVLPDIPTLALPTVPDALRSLVRRILTANKDAQSRTELIHFLAARGFTTHPADWMPAAADDDAPDVYASWRDWADIAAANAVSRQPIGDLITAQNWDDFWPAARKVALTALRRRDPAAARAVMEAKLGQENADVRLRLLALLSDELSDGDAAFLEGLAANDRASKVKALATSLLARLGHAASPGEDTAELAGFFSVKTKGLLRRSRVIQFENTKTAAQLQRRQTLFDGADVTSLATALGLTPQELVTIWSWGEDKAADVGLVNAIVQTGTDALVAAAADLVAEQGRINIVLTLVPRLAPSQRARRTETALRASELRFEIAKLIAGPAARLDDPLAAPAGTALITALRRDDAKPSDQAVELHALGLIVSRAAARQILDRLTGAGLLQGDPRLDMLRLNAALDDNGAKP